MKNLSLKKQQLVNPTLRFSPTAWAKLLYMRDIGDAEVGGFGITARDDLLFVDDIRFIRQDCSPVTVSFNDEAVAEYFDEQIDRGLKPEQFARLWIHTHPGECPLPSPTDEETFERVFGQSEWAVMFILAREGQSYARLRFNVGPGTNVLLPVEINFDAEFGGSNFDEWKKEYTSNVHVKEMFNFNCANKQELAFEPIEKGEQSEWYEDWFDYVDDPEFVLQKGRKYEYTD